MHKSLLSCAPGSGSAVDGPPRKRRAYVCTGAWIFLIALAVRLLNVYFFRSTVFFEQPIFDEAFYHEQATAISMGNWVGHEVHFMGPLYSYFLALMYAISNGSRLFALIVQSVVGAGTCALTYFVAREIFSERVAVLAGIITIFYGVLIFYDGLLLMETLTLFMNMLCLLALIRGGRTGKPAYVFAAGFCLGVSALGRASVLLFGLGALVLILSKYPRPGKRRALAAVFAAAVLVVVMPVAISNYGIEGDFTLISANGGLNFYIGNGPGANGTFRILSDTGVAPGDMTGKFEAEVMSGRQLTLAETSRWWYGETFAFIRAHPLSFLRNLVWKIRLVWNTYEIPQLEWYDATRAYSPVLGLPLVTSGFVIPFALLGIIVGAKYFRRTPCLLTYIAAQTIAFSLFFVTARYRLAVLPALAICAAYGLVWLFGVLRRRRSTALFSIAGLALLFWLTAPGRLELDMDELRRWHTLNLGLRYGATSSGLDRGVELLEGAAMEFPGDADTRKYYGIVLRRAGRYGPAFRELKAAAALRPADPVIPFQIGKTHGEMGADSLAVLAFMEAISLAPLYKEAYEQLAFAYSRQGRYEDALTEFARAVRIDPTSSSLRLNLGVTYGKLGREADAIEELELAVYYDRANWKARYNLAVALAAAGRLEEARGHLEAILTMQPDNELARRAFKELGGSVTR